MLLIPYLQVGRFRMSLTESEVVRHSPNHRWSFETDTPTMHADILWKSHGLKHFGAEHPAVPDFNPLLKRGVESKDLK